MHHVYSRSNYTVCVIYFYTCLAIIVFYYLDSNIIDLRKTVFTNCQAACTSEWHDVSYRLIVCMQMV